MLSPAPHRAATVAARPQCRTLQMAPGRCTSSCHPCHHTDALLCRWLQGAPSFMALMHSVACCHLCTLPCRWMTDGQQGLPPSCRSCLSLHRRTALHRVPDRCHDLPPWCRKSACRHTGAVLCRWFQVGGEAPRQKPLPHGERRASTACPSRRSKSRAQRASDCGSSADSMDEQATGELDVI